MRAPFQAGEFPAPVKYGYASVGQVEEGPGTLPGKTVFCLYPHQTGYVVPAAAVHVVPDSVPAGRAVLAANLETAVNGLWDADLRTGDRVAVVGAGTIGILLAWCVRRIAGCDVVLVDTNPHRAEIAARLDLAFLEPDAALASHAQSCQRILHTSGSAEGLRLALQLAAFEATVIEMSWYGAREVTLPLGEAFHALRLTLKSSQVGTVAATQRHRWTASQRLAFALSLLEDPALDVLINSECDFGELPLKLPQLLGAPGNVLCHRINYPS